MLKDRNTYYENKCSAYSYIHIEDIKPRYCVSSQLVSHLKVIKDHEVQVLQCARPLLDVIEDTCLTNDEWDFQLTVICTDDTFHIIQRACFQCQVSITLPISGT